MCSGMSSVFCFCSLFSFGWGRGGAEDVGTRGTRQGFREQWKLGNSKLQRAIWQARKLRFEGVKGKLGNCLSVGSAGSVLEAWRCSCDRSARLD